MGQRSWQLWGNAIGNPGNVYLFGGLRTGGSRRASKCHIALYSPATTLIAPASHLLGLRSEPKAARIYRAG